MSSDEKKPSSGGSSHRIPKAILMGLVGLYGVSNMALFISASMAWSTTKTHAQKRDCLLNGPASCGFTRWAIYSFISAASLINTISTGTMAVHGLMRTRGTHVDPLYVFRGSFFSLLLLAPVVYIGWTNMHTVPSNLPSPEPDHLPESEDSVLGRQLHFVGLSGGFILENLDHTFKGAKTAYYMTHFTVLFGALVTAVAAALAPPAGVLVGGLVGGQAAPVGAV